MTDKTVAELMALADAYADAAADGVGMLMAGGIAEEQAAKAALEQAIRRAVDWGEPVAFVTEEDARCFHSGPGESIFLFTKKAKWHVPLYARNKP